MLSTLATTPPHMYVIKPEDRAIVNSIAEVRQPGDAILRCRKQICYDVETGKLLKPGQHTPDGVYIFFWKDLGQ